MSKIETVEVPAEAMRQLKGWFGDNPDSYVAGSGLPALLKVEVPQPLEVGTTITGQQFAALPPRSVAVDTDGDVWVLSGENAAALVQKEGALDYSVSDYYLATDMGQGVLVHIGATPEEN